MNARQALLVAIRDTPVERATRSRIGHHPKTLDACLRKGWAVEENETLALTDRGRAEIANLQTCRGCVSHWHGICLQTSKPVRVTSPSWCPGKVRPLV